MVNAAEARARALRLKLVLTDVDGVLTDAGVYYSSAGEQLKRFSVRDGMGVERLRRVQIETGFITRERSALARRRAEKLGLRFVYLGIRDKRAHLEHILRDTNISASQLAYIGDDCNDLDLLEEIGRSGLTAAPADAMPEVLHLAHYCCAARGGEGAFRDFAEWILRLRNSAGREELRVIRPEKEAALEVFVRP